MPWWKWLGGALLVAVGVGAGAFLASNAILEEASERIEGPPAVVSADLSWGEVSEDRTTVLADLQIHNPNEISVTVENVSTSITLEEITVGTVRSPGFDLEANTTSTVQLTARFDNGGLLDWWLIHTANGEESESTIAFDLELATGPVEEDVAFEVDQPLQTDVAGQIERSAESDPSGCPNRESHPHPSGQREDRPHPWHFPCIVEAETRWEGNSEEQSVLVSDLAVYNPNREPVFLNELRLRALLHQVPTAEGHLTEPVRIDPEETETVTVRATSTHEDLRRWWPMHVNGACEQSPVEAELVFEYEGHEWTAPLPISEHFSTNLIC